MLMGAFFGIFEEVVPLVPVIIALSYSLGWDALTGLGMSILAVNLGFSAAITNPVHNWRSPEAGRDCRCFQAPEFPDHHFPDYLC
jgi:hypothetical protein